MAVSLIGQQLKEFTIQERIGRGGMATVYRAYQPSVKRDVALKVIELASDEQSLSFEKRFAQEAELIARLEHIHILPVYDYGLVKVGEDDLAYIAMRLLRGGTLSDVIRERPLEVEQAATLFNQFASGLNYAHSKGIIHRDLKPSNIMLDDAGNSYVTDFGLAKLIAESGEFTRTDKIVGTPHYMSPEQLRGESIDHRADIYSLGVVLYRTLVGQLPFDSSTDLVAMIYQKLEHEPPLPSDLNPDIPAGVTDVIMRAMQRDPDARYDSATDMAADLNRVLGRGSSSTLSAHRPVSRTLPAATRTDTPRETPRKAFQGRGGWWLLGLVALLIVAGGALGVFLSQGGDSADTATSAPRPTPQVLAGESTPSEDTTPSEAEIALAVEQVGEDGFLAFITCNQDSEYHSTLAREMRDFALEAGLPFRIYDSDNDAYTQLTSIERARSEGARAFIICPLDHELLDAPLTSAQAAGLPLVLLHGDINSYGGVRITGDNYLTGYRPGLYAGEVVRDELGGQAEVIILDFPSMDDIVIRADGLQDGLLENAPDANIIGRYVGGVRELAAESVGELLAEGVTFDVILSINDAGAYGAIDALEAADIPPDAVMIFSVDAESLARQYIAEGYYFRGSVNVSRTDTARASVNAVIKLLSGAPVAENILSDPGDMVTRESLAEVSPP